MSDTSAQKAETSVLTLDIGSSSIRANLYSKQGKQLPGVEAKVEYKVNLTPDGGVEIGPADILTAVAEAVDIALRNAGKQAGSIAGVGICSLVSNIMGVDSEGKALTPIYTWADTRCAKQAAALRTQWDEAQVLERTGCTIHSSYLPARILWLRQTMPDIFARAAQWLTIGDWLQLNLFGQTAQSVSAASWSGLLNRHTLEWDPQTLEAIDLDPGTLPRLVDFNEGLSGLRNSYTSRWPVLAHVPWFPCVGDGATGNAGSGCLHPDVLGVQVGTSGAIRAMLRGTPKSVPEGLWCYRVSRADALIGGAISEGGNFTKWLRESLNTAALEALEQEAATARPDSHGLTVLPFIAGERSVGWHDSARATFSGIGLKTKPADLYRATLEAVAYRFYLIYEAMSRVLPPTRKVVASGGALLGTPGWMGILADVLNVEVVASGEEQASSRGTALMALEALGIISGLDELPAQMGETFTPNAEHHSIYMEAVKRQQELYNAVVSKDSH